MTTQLEEITEKVRIAKILVKEAIYGANQDVLRKKREELAKLEAELAAVDGASDDAPAAEPTASDPTPPPFEPQRVPHDHEAAIEAERKRTRDAWAAAEAANKELDEANRQLRITKNELATAKSEHAVEIDTLKARFHTTNEERASLKAELEEIKGKPQSPEVASDPGDTDSQPMDGGVGNNVDPEEG